MRRMQVWGGAVLAGLLVVAGLGWFALSPGWATRLVSERIAAETGRAFTASGGAHLDFVPQLSIRLDRVSLSNPADPDGSFITADALRIPVSLSQLVMRRIDVTHVDLDGPSIAFTINERGETSWDFPGTSGLTFGLGIRNGTLRYFDARSGQGLVMSNANLTANVEATDDVTVRGSATINGRLARLDGYVKSVRRLHQDGSPAGLTLDSPDLSVTFDGRLSTAAVLNLAGTVALTSGDPLAAARWAGIDVNASEWGTLRLSGALESSGRTFAVRQASLTIGGNAATGDVAMDFRDTVPKLQASLEAPSFDLTPFIPAGNARPGEWGTVPLSLGQLKAANAEVSLSAATLAFGAIKAGPAELHFTVDQGRLDGTLVLAAIAGGRARIGIAADGAAVPPGLAIGIKCEEVDMARLLPDAIGVTWLSGIGQIGASLSGSGETQQAFVGSMQGQFDMELKNGAIMGLGLREGLAAVSQRIAEGWPGGGPAAFATLAVKSTIGDGIAKVSAIDLNSPELAISGQGDVDLLRRSLDLRVNPRLKSPNAETGLPVAIVVSGSWGSPRIYPDLPGILSHPEAAFRQLKSMGLPAAAN